MTIFVGADHRGFELKSRVLEYLADKGVPFEDFGAFELDPDDDYNDTAVKVAEAVLKNPGSYGLLFCGSGHGETIQTNRFKGIRAVLGFNKDLAHMGREHNDANILCFPADFSADNYAEIIEEFLSTAFLDTERYTRRNKKLDEVS
jgi:ribose 5-phosphate isomerase B